MSGTSYRTEVIPCRRGEAEIFGKAFIPEGEGRRPLVIFSHELGDSHKSGIPYAERLAAAGYAAYTYDFRGGSVGKNQSSGANVGMSVMTEVSDLEAVLAKASSWEFADPERIVLLGGSQGAVVTAVAGCRNAERIAGMMLLYPPFTIPDEMRARFRRKERILAEFDLFGGWMRVGGNYAADVWDLDVYDELALYQGDVLLLHGDRDSTVPLSVSKRAANVIPRCEFHVIEGGRHGFTGAAFEAAAGHILRYMEKIDRTIR